jgi:hypothetical protein
MNRIVLKIHFEAEREISVRIGQSLGEAHALRSLSDLARLLDDPDDAKKQLGAARVWPGWR